MSRTHFAVFTLFVGVFGTDGSGVAVSAASDGHSVLTPADRPTDPFVPLTAAVYRGQSPSPFFGGDAGGGVVGQPGIPGGNPGGIPTSDPFLSGVQTPQGGFDPYGGGYFGNTPNFGFDPTNGGFASPGTFHMGTEIYGINGPQPYRFGWQERFDVAINSGTDTSPDVGDFALNEVNFIKQYTGRGPGAWIYTWDPEFNYRWTDGPGNNFYRFRSGFTAATPLSSNSHINFGFRPGIATDLEQTIDRDGWQFDGDITGTFRLGPRVTLVAGVFYWDRLDDIVLPSGGLVWTPSQVFELRATFPKATAELFLGTPYGVPTWVYVSGEYDVESYQTSTAADFAAGAGDVVQISDWKFMVGAKFESGWLQTFVEAGIVVDREIEVESAPDVDVDTSFLGRVGLRF